MEFDEHARLDTRQISDQRGRGGLSSFPRGGLAIGGGMGIIGLIIALLLGINPLSSGSSSTSSVASDLVTECRTGADANTRDDCRVVGIVDSVQKLWDGQFAAKGQRYETAQTVLFTEQTDTRCGAASSDVGPFYCAADGYVYLDLGFFGDLRTKFGASGGPFAQAYVVAHEYGHHVQDLLDTMSK